ncbi:uncharacterized protein LOC142337005 isoform X1 [Convolutriloba macropyga]|uniref:uncharacterized protein LOC142337005 isoform X1 n=1 Tax=Convolutriloba macropyga TaxID=536237 RepID=UPI003F526DB4
MQRFDVLFGDEIVTGVVLAGRKHNIPTISQSIGPLSPTARLQPPFLERSDLAREDAEKGPSLMSVICSTLFDAFMEAAISYPFYNTLKQIHSEQGWEDLSYDYGKFPFSYIHRHSVLLSHGAPPVSKKRGQHYENVQSIGFVPDDFMYPPLSAELSDWLEKADGPVVFISLGTITVTSKEESKLLFEQLTFQDKFYFIWAVKKSALEDLEILEPPFISKRLFLGQYLPQGKILQHQKVKIFVTHCGANSMLDSVNGVKPMITYPGFADQPILSNTLIAEKVAKLLKQFTYLELEPILDGMLAEPNYSEMVTRLEEIKNYQVRLGGNKRAVEVIEQMAEGMILVNRTMASEDVFGIALYDVIAVCASLIAFIVFALIGLIIFCFRLFLSRPIRSIEKLQKKD